MFAASRRCNSCSLFMKRNDANACCLRCRRSASAVLLGKRKEVPASDTDNDPFQCCTLDVPERDVCVRQKLESVGDGRSAIAVSDNSSVSTCSRLSISDEESSYSSLELPVRRIAIESDDDDETVDVRGDVSISNRSGLEYDDESNCGTESEYGDEPSAIGSDDESIVSDDDDDAFMRFDACVLHCVESSNFCRNCFRSQLHQDVTNDDYEEYRVKLVKVHSSEVVLRTRWKSFDREDVANSDFLLCMECYDVLSKSACDKRKSRKSRLTWCSIWPVYIWKMLSDRTMIDRYGVNILRFVPSEWHKYWMSSLKVLDPCFDRDLDCTVTVDVTRSRNEFCSALASMKLGRIKRACNDHLYPVILCPWGCSGYIHHDGFIEFDSIVARHFPFLPSAGKVSGRSKTERAVSSRDDFFSDYLDAWYYNPRWTVRPSVAYIEGKGPVFMTCKDHNGGTRNIYFHMPRSGSCLPAKNAESLSHAVLRSRTLRTTQAHKYTHTYQMNKCMASYSGIDTCVVSETRRFDFCSHLTDINEARSYFGRDDIKGLVAQLERIGTVPSQFVDNLKSRSEELFGSGELLNTLSSGATMMTLDDCVQVQRMISSPSTIEIDVVSTKNGSESMHKKIIKRHWPLCLVRVHTNNSWGARPYIYNLTSRMSGGRDLRALWLLSNMIMNVPKLWTVVGECVSSTDGWQGYLLSFLCKKIMNNRSAVSKKENPFCLSTADSRFKPQGLCSLLFRFGRVRAGHFVGFDTAFDPHQFKFIVGREIDTGKLAVLELPLASSVINAGAFEGREAVILHGSCNRTLPHRLHSSHGEYEIRFMAMTSPGNTASSWKGRIFVRHGSVCFPKWWHYDRDCLVTQTDEDPTIQCSGFQHVVAVYVLQSTVSVEQYKKDYLKYIGGQDRCVCYVHKVPLITSKCKRGPDTCYCSHASHLSKREPIEFQCPVHCCNVGLCKGCFEDVSGPPPINISMRFDNGQQNGRSSFELDGSYLEEEDREDTGSEDGCIDLPVFDDARRVDLSDMATGDEHVDFDAEHAIENGNEGYIEQDYNAFEGVIQTTHAAADRQEFDATFGTMGVSVLLNKCGTMLVRRDSTLRASRRERHLIERVVSSADIGTVPIVYLEGILFPSIFWSLPHSIYGGVLGCMPTVLHCQHQTRRQFNIASVIEHARMHLKSAGSTTSTDSSFLSFKFDTVSNGALEGNDTRVVMIRGFEECMGPAGIRMRNAEDDFVTDQIDSRQNVHNLCASERDKPSTLFVTMTCNQREHFGIAPVKQYIDDGEALENYKRCRLVLYPREKALNSTEEREIQQAFVEASRSLICRNWLEVKSILLRYILKSEERPFGKVLKIFSRDEYQTDSGNLCHLHMLITLDKSYDEAEGRSFIESIIRGFVDEIVGVDEVEDYISQGLLDSWDDYATMKEQARNILVHRCSKRCKRRTGTGTGDLVCRVPDTRKVSPDLTKFFQLNLNVEHDASAVQIMERLGLCQPTMTTGGVFVPNEEFLRAKRVFPVARQCEGIISPVIGRLFAATRSSMNVQICTSFGTSRYIVKYLIKIDENNYVAFHAKQGDNTIIKAEQVFLHNTKISSSAMHERKKLNESRHANRPRGRALATTEMQQILMGYPQIYSNIEFVKVPTLPLGERPGVERVCPKDKASAEGIENEDSFDILNPSVSYRHLLYPAGNNLRCVTASQIVLLKDQMLSNVSIDRVTVFGLRPPELLCIDRMEDYFKLFHRTSIPVVKKDCLIESLVHKDLEKSYLIDCLGHQIMLRASGARQLLKQILDGYYFPRDKQYAAPMKKLLLKLCRLQISSETDGLLRVEKREWARLKNLFVYGCAEDPLPVVVFSNVSPKNASKFVIHVLLSLGRFNTESDLWVAPSMRTAFVNAKLLPFRQDGYDKSDVNTLLDIWVRDQLRYYPIGNRKFDEYMISADNILQSVILRDEIPIDEMPPYLYTSLIQNVNNDIIAYHNECKENLVNATLQSLSRVYGDSLMKDICPSKDELMNATKFTPVAWVNHLPKTSRQSDESFSEQMEIQQQASECINTYVRSTTSAARNYLITGPPGAGKTHCMSHSIIYALAQGLVATTTAVLADRAFLLGGKHIHKLFRLPVREGKTVHRMAELGVVNLQKYPTMLSFLRVLDVLFIDEMGQLSAEMLSVLDVVLRRIRDSSLFMGGVLIIGTLDQVQLRPIKGLPFLLSPYVLTTFLLGKLQHYVRCGECPILQEINEICRMFTPDRDLWRSKLKRLRRLLSMHCTFVDSWDDALITDSVLRVFPHREQKDRAVRQFTESKRKYFQMANIGYCTSKARDEMSPVESHGDPIAASKPVTHYLNRKCSEPETIDLFVGGIYQFTYNNPGRFNATQIGVIVDQPSQDSVDDFDDISIMVAPPGVKTIDIESLSKAEMLECGWKETVVGIAPQYSRTIWSQGVKATRKQYALVMNIASTIHSAIGHTVSGVATELNCGSLWERAMVVVLLSRVSMARELIFVGDKKGNIDTIINGLQKKTQYDDYMNHVVDVIHASTSEKIESMPLNLSLHPFRPKDIPLPVDDSGTVYMIASVTTGHSVYIGMTQNMYRRLKQHNSGYGAIESCDPRKRPWALIGYIAGFGGDRKLMRAVESCWQGLVRNVRPDNPFDAAALGSQVVSRFQGDSLLLVLASV